MSGNVKGLANKEELAAILSDMVRIDSVNTLFGKGGGNEAGMVEYVKKFCDDNGFEYTVQDVLPGRQQVLIHVKGNGTGALCFEAHMDTVTVDDMTIAPFEPVIKDGKLYGRGSCDCKGSVATMLYALKLLKDNDLTPYCDIYFCAAAEEEFSYKGVLKLLEQNIHFDAAIVGEPTSVNILPACKGNCRFKIMTKGRSGHSSRPWEGKNAIVAMSRIVLAIEENLIPEYNKIHHPLLNSPTINVSIISGGKIINSVPDYCEIQIDRRTMPGDTYESVKKEIETAIKPVIDAYPDIEYEIGAPFVLDIPMETPVDEKIVKTAEDCCQKIMGRSTVEGAGFSCDASKLKRAGIPSIVMGPGSINKAHAADEFCPIDELPQAAETYAQICLDFRP